MYPRHDIVSSFLHALLLIAMRKDVVLFSYRSRRLSRRPPPPRHCRIYLYFGRVHLVNINYRRQPVVTEREGLRGRERL